MAQKKSTSTATKKAPEAKTAPAKKVKAKEEKVAVNPKLADPNPILAAYDNLIDVLAKTEAQQRLKNKPYRVYFVHRKRQEVMRLNFLKSLR